MKKRILLLFSSVVASLGLISVAMPSLIMAADVQGNICHGSDKLNLNSGSDESCGTETITGAQETLNDKIAKVINILSIIVGIVAVIMVIIAGFRYVTSGGNEQTLAAAKKTLLYAIIGVIIAVLAQVLVRFVLQKSTHQGSSSSMIVQQIKLT